MNQIFHLQIWIQKKWVTRHFEENEQQKRHQSQHINIEEKKWSSKNVLFIPSNIFKRLLHSKTETIRIREFLEVKSMALWYFIKRKENSFVGRAEGQ